MASMNVDKKPIVSINGLYGSIKYVTTEPMNITTSIKSRYDYRDRLNITYESISYDYIGYDNKYNWKKLEVPGSQSTQKNILDRNLFKKNTKKKNHV